MQDRDLPGPFLTWSKTMRDTRFGDRQLINQQHLLSKQIRIEEEAEKEQKKLKKRYTVSVSYSVTREYTDKINLFAYDEDDANSLARDWVDEQGDDVDVFAVEIVSEAYEFEEENDNKTLDMFNHDFDKSNKSK